MRKSKVIDISKHKFVRAEIYLPHRHWRWLVRDAKRLGMSHDERLNLLIGKYVLGEADITAVPVTPEIPGHYEVSDIIRALIEQEWKEHQ